VDQVVSLNELAISNYGIPLSNIVLMGMGEPLLNYKQVIAALEILTDPNRFNISPRRITLSTAGIAKMIMKLGDEQVRFNLALSLHAADDIKRSEVMEINDSNNLESLRDALIYFHERTASRITFEYILFRDFNDSMEDAANLANFARCVPCKINIIEYNSIGDSKFAKASVERTEAFTEFLERRNLIVNVRRSRGKDIDAACGQLANKNNQATKSL
jgi:23S rRNA (adenine2503-C2)-methyltransferase